MHEQITNAGAVGAVASPFWLPALHDLSTVAAETAPILGAVWLAIQIIAKAQEMRRRRRQG